MARFAARDLSIAALCAAASFSACQDDAPVTPAAELRGEEQAVVYGSDDRQDLYEVQDQEWRALATNAIVALVPQGRLDRSNPDSYTPAVDTLQERRDLCDDELFLTHPAMANCSGTLVDDDLVITAGHCVDDLEDCQGNLFVFDFYYEGEGDLQTIGPEDVYECERLVTRRLEGNIDYAVVQLDRPVTGRAPANVKRETEALTTGDSIVVIGFGSGIPAKFDDGGFVLDPRADVLDHFEGSPDTFGGNSGSGVFDENRQMVGILVRGASDYVTDGDCTRVSVLPQDGAGSAEDMVYVSNALQALCETDVSSVLCDGRGGFCRPCALSEECLDGFVCAEDSASGARTCTALCEDSEDCRGDHTCAGGICVPAVESSCIEGDVWQTTSCGAPIDIESVCELGSFCNLGACVEAGGGNTCEAAVELTLAPGEFDDVLVSEFYTDDFSTECGGTGIDRVYELIVPQPSSVQVDVSGFDTVLSIRSICDAASSELDCSDDSRRVGGGGSRINADLEPGSYFLIVESFGTDEGEFTLDVETVTNCPCAVGSTICDGTFVSVCNDLGNPCPEFVSAPCQAGETCSSGACVQQSEGDSCDSALLLPAVTGSVSGDLSTGYGNDGEGRCGGDAADAVYELQVVEPMDITLTLEGGEDAVLHVRGTCDSVQTERDCDAARENAAQIVEEYSPGTYFVFVDSDGDVEGYTLSVDAQPTCTDQCGPEGEVACLDDVTYRDCGQFDEDSCLDFGPRSTCEESAECTSTGCVSTEPEVEPMPDAGPLEDAGADAVGGPTAGSGGDSSGCAVLGGAASGAASMLWLLPLLGLRRRRR
ncbi:MAG: hypothetical protein ACI81R_000626 [Bradymonadia bacterium]|jgi:hypothetical protein